MKRKTVGKKERRTRIGIVTNRMSDEVYSLLVEKGKANELTKYVVDLIERDMTEDFIQSQFELAKENLKDINESIVRMKNNINEIN